MSDEKLIWIRSDKLKDQLAEGIYFDLLNKAIVTKSEQFTDFQWVAFDPGTETGQGAELISDLKNTYHGIPPVLKDSSYPEEPENSGNSNQNDKNKILYTFFVAAAPSIWEVMRTAIGRNWDKSALTSRIENNLKNTEVVKIENLSTNILDTPKQANVWIKHSPIQSIQDFTTSLTKAINHRGTQKPYIEGLKKVDSTSEKPGKEDINKDKLENIPWKKISYFAIGGIALYALNTISNFTGEE